MAGKKQLGGPGSLLMAAAGFRASLWREQVTVGSSTCKSGWGQFSSRGGRFMVNVLTTFSSRRFACLVLVCFESQQCSKTKRNRLFQLKTGSLNLAVVPDDGESK